MPLSDKPTFAEQFFALLEGPVASSLIKVIATILICGTTVLLTLILAMASAPLYALLSTVGMGLGITGVVWIFGGWKKQGNLLNQYRKHEKEVLRLNDQIGALEERLGNVEVIERFEDRLAKTTIQSSTFESE